MLHGLLNPSRKTLKPSIVRATVTSEASAKALKDTVKSDSGVQIKVSHGPAQHVEVANNSDVIILACPPPAMSSVLGEPDLQKALHGKTLVSVLAGVTTTDIGSALGGAEGQIYVFRALPNLAVATGESATAVEQAPESYPAEKVKLVDTIFKQLGRITHLPGSMMDASTVLCGSTPAFIALFLDGMVDGAVAAGVPRTKANAMIAQVLGSTTALLQNDDGSVKGPSALREEVCAMPGCTIKGSMVLDECGVRTGAGRAMKEAIEAASGLGKK